MMGAEDRDEDAGAGRGRKLKNSNDPSAPWSEHSHILGSGRLRRVVARYGNDNHLRIELVFNTVVEICLCKRRIVDCQPIIGVID